MAKSRECQTSDWPSHKVWCKTHKASTNTEQADWRDLHRHMPLWRKAHTQALREALISSLDLPRNPAAHRVSALRLYLVYHPDRDPAVCMQVERIVRMKYVGQDGRQRQQLSESRAHYERQFILQNTGTCYGAGLAILSVKHKGDPDGLTLYAVPLEISMLDARESPCSFWMELLAKRLHVGMLVDPEMDHKVRDEVLRMYAHNSARTEQSWEWDADDEEGAYQLAQQLALMVLNVFVDEGAASLMPPYPFRQIVLDKGLDNAFMTTFSSSQQRAVINLAKSYADRLENGTRQEHEQMGVFGMGTTTEEAKRRLPDTWEVLGALDKVYWRLAQWLRRSSPSRTGEAEPYLRRVAEIKAQFAVQGVDADASLLLYWAAALANVPGKEDEALRTFDRGVRATHVDGHLLTDLWARANICRMLRRVGKVARAKKEENIAATWISRNVYVYHPAKIRKCVFDDHDPYGTNHIMEHPLVKPLLTAMDTPLNSPFNWTLQLGVIGTVSGE
ncbi:hypothetical protein EIP86_010230 [Pleurotus ostreatoroseus]|nr:hypothetical protein EIP86_010230 [Pleurotus ostreatoroseus]